MNRLTSISSNTNIKLPKHFHKYFIIGYSSHVDPLIETIPYLSHARSRNFGCTLNPSNSNYFWQICFQTSEKITRLQGTIKNTVSLRFVSLPSSSINRPPRGHLLTGNRQSNDRLLISSSPHCCCVSLLQSFWDQVPRLQSFLSGMLFTLYESFE